MNLSYLIKKNKKGNYIHFKIKGDGKIISELPKNIEAISDLGTGGGIPGIPIGITTNLRVNLIDVKEKRIFELSRLIKILNKNKHNLVRDIFIYPLLTFLFFPCRTVVPDDKASSY
mgnify:CR=1 FL=1